MKNPASKSNGNLFAPAKINLGLRIVSKRPDGYHDLRSLFVTLSAGDDVTYAATETGWSGSCDRADVPMGSDSLAGRAFRFAAERLNYKGGLKIQIQKRIPMGAGLGGGSSDAATVMRAVERLTERKLDEAYYPEIAFQIGADVPFFLKGGAQWVEGVGERLTPVTQMPPLFVLLVHPGVAIATKWVFESFGQNLQLNQLTSENSAATLPPSFSSIACLSRYLTNDLESVVLPHYPVVAEIKKRLGALGADAALMSGSGSTVYGLYSDPEKRNKAAEVLKSENPQWWVCACESFCPRN